jgi:hypothetical protein
LYFRCHPGKEGGYMPAAASKKPRKDRYTGPIKLDDTKMETIEPRTNVPKVDLREYIEGLKASRQSGQSVGHTIVADSVNILKSRYRQAAQQLGYGVSFTLALPGSELAIERGYDLAPGDARLLVKAGPKLVRAPKPAEVATDGATATTEPEEPESEEPTEATMSPEEAAEAAEVAAAHAAATNA